MKLKDIYRYAFSELGYDKKKHKADIEFLISSVLGLNRFDIYLNPDIELGDREIVRIKKLLSVRLKNYPLSWIIGRHNFSGIDIVVNKGVFVPRPETEELANMVLKESFKYSTPEILDFCAGSGAIGLYIACKNPNARVYGIEKSKKALKNIKINVELLKLKNYRFAGSNSIFAFDRKYDIIVSNPPYIPRYMYEYLPENVKFEPKTSLVSGDDGLDMVRYIIKNSPKLLKENGILYMEVGEYYDKKLKYIMNSSRFKTYSILKDINGKTRFIRAVYG